MKIKKCELREESVGATSYREHQRAKKTKMYFHMTGETVLEDLTNRRERPMKEFRKHFKEVFQKIGIPEAANLKWSWSQYAGCTCPCSPGFVLKEYNKALAFKTIYVDVAL